MTPRFRASQLAMATVALRRRIRITFAAGALAVVAMIAPATSFAQSPITDAAVGSGSVNEFPSFRFNVSSGPSGENPSGSATAVFLDQTLVAASIDCLAVSGNTATFAGSLGPSSSFYRTFEITVVDNGSTG